MPRGTSKQRYRNRVTGIYGGSVDTTPICRKDVTITEPVHIPYAANLGHLRQTAQNTTHLDKKT